MRARTLGVASLLFITATITIAHAGSATAGKAAPASPAASPPTKTLTTTTSSTAAVPEGLVAAKDALGKDVLDEVLAANSSKYASPSATFRAGGVHPHPAGKDAVSKVGGGFRVNFTSGTQITTPAVYDGTLFVSGGFSSRELYAFDAKTGKPKWAIDLDDDGPSAPACADGVCVVNTESCTLFVVEAKTGNLVWSKWLGDPLMSAATISNGKVFASYPVSSVDPGGEKKARPRPSNASHALAAFDLKSGKVLWQRWIDGDVMSSPVAVDGRVWITTFSGTVYEMNETDGKILSARKSRATSAPVVVAGNLYFSARADDGGKAGEAIVAMGGDGQSYVAAKKAAVYLDRSVQAASSFSTKGLQEDSNNGFGGGAPATANAAPAADLVGQASVSTLQAHQGSRLVSLDDRNVSTMGDEVVATDSKTGKKLWTVKLKGDAKKEGGYLATSPVAAGKSILVGTIEGEILQINAADGVIVHRWPAGAPLRSQPIVQDGWIYAGTADGRLIAIDTGDKTLTGWTQWGGNEKRDSIAHH